MTPANSNRVLILFALLLAVGIGAMGYFSREDSVAQLPPVTATTATASAASPKGVDVSGWQTYASDKFGFSLQYPETWQIQVDDATTGTIPSVTFGDSLEGAQTYAMQVWIVKTPSVVSAADYVKKLLKDDMAKDAARAKHGPAPRVTPTFNEQYPVKIGSYDGYELFNVFAFDHNAEQIYVANGHEVLVFSFPIAADNPNLSSPAENNAIAHAILDTLQLSLP